MNSETQAPHAAHQLSPLLVKARLVGLSTAEELARLAVRRGCSYYDVRPQASEMTMREEPSSPVSRSEFSNAELAVALLSPHWESQLLLKRMGASMMSAPDVDDKELAALAITEGCPGLVRYIAQCGMEVEPANVFWLSLESRLADFTFDPDAVPHPTRFIEMTGISRGKVALQKRWVRPIAALALVG